MRYLAWFAAVLLAAVLLVLLVFRFQPAWLLGAAESTTGARITADTVDLTLWPLNIQLQNFAVAAPGLSIGGDRLETEIALWDWQEGKPFWSLWGERIELTTAPVSEQTAPAETAPTESGLEETTTEFAIPPLLLDFKQVRLTELQWQDQTWSIDLQNGDRMALQATLSAAQSNVGVQGEADIRASENLVIHRPDLQISYNNLDPLLLQGGRLMINDRHMTSEDVSIVMQDNTLLVNLDVEFAPLRVTGTLHSPGWTLPASEAVETEDPEGPPADQDLADAVLFSDEPLPILGLSELSMDVQMTATEINFNQQSLTDVSAHVTLQDGQLTLPVSARLGEGLLDHQLTLQVSDTVEVAAKLDYQDINLGALLASGLVQGGAVTAKAALQAKGTSSRDMASSLVGQFSVMLTDAQVANEYIDSLGSDLILETVNKLNPFQAQDPNTSLECALLNVPVTDGVADLDGGLFVQTGKMNIAGSGNLDLGQETLDVTLTPSARQGLGVNVASLVKFIKLGGSLLNPQPQLDSVGVLQSGLAIGAAVSTGGASLVAEGLAKRALNAGSPCADWVSAQAAVD